MFSSLYLRRPSAPTVEMLYDKIGWVLKMCLRACATWAFPLRLSELWLALKLVPKAPLDFLKPNKITSTGEPSTKASVDDCAKVYERTLLAAMLSRPAAASVVEAPKPPEAFVVVRFAFNYFIVLRAFSLLRRSSSTVSPFFTARRETKPWYLSMSATCKLIYF